MDGARGVVDRMHVGEAHIEHAGHGEHLEHRAHLVNAEAEPVEPVLVERLLAMVGIEIGQRHETDNLARMHVEDDAGRGLGMERGHGVRELLAQHVLHAEIERDGDGFVARGGLGMRHGELRVVVDELLDAGEASRIDVDQPHHVARDRTHGIDPPILLDETETGEPELVDFLLLLRGQLAPDANESPACFQPFAQVGGVDVGKHARHLLDELVDIDHLGGIGIEGRALDVGGEQPAAAIEDVGPVHGGGDVVQAAQGGLVFGEAEGDEAAADQDEGDRKGEAGEPEAVAAARKIGPLGAGRSSIRFGGIAQRLARFIGPRLGRE